VRITAEADCYYAVITERFLVFVYNSQYLKSVPGSVPAPCPKNKIEMT